MLKSMTAYSRVSTVSTLGHFSIELQSVNRKHLEINTLGIPKEFVRYDADIRKWIAAAVGRGQVNVRICAAFDAESPLVVMPNLALARQLKEAWGVLAKDIGMEVDNRGLLTILSKVDDIMLYDENTQDLDAYRDMLHVLVEKALAQFLAMKVAEGKALHDDISMRFALLGKWIEEIAVKAPQATDRYRQKLQERLQEVLGASTELDERLLREVCVYADKIDIAEELTRFQSHLQQSAALINSKAQSIGKTLEFIVQELNREVNTIGSKSSDVDVSRTVIAIKTELERIREQIQNIE
ncbi:MAG: YicC/YloC family endoribonuclease [Parachlamydiaceae bacterium]